MGAAGGGQEKKKGGCDAAMCGINGSGGTELRTHVRTTLGLLAMCSVWRPRERMSGRFSRVCVSVASSYTHADVARRTVGMEAAGGRTVLFH